MSRLIVKSPYIQSGGKANGYMRYMATHLGTEKRGAHGLFGNADCVDLKQAMAELSEVQGNIWTHIISLRREDAECQRQSKNVDLRQ